MEVINYYGDLYENILFNGYMQYVFTFQNAFTSKIDLLESIGIYNRDLMLHYYRKIKKFMIWYRNKHNKFKDKVYNL